MSPAARSLASVIAVLLGSALLGACGGEPDGARHAARYERLALTPTGGTPPERDPRTFVHFTPGEMAESEADARAYELVSLPMTEAAPASEALELRGAGQVSLTLRRSYPAGSFNRATVGLVVERREEVELRFWRGGELVHRSESQIFVGGGEPRTLSFDLEELMATSAALDAVSLHCLRANNPVQLTSFTLLFAPAAAWLPDAAGPAQLTAIGTDRRRAVGLVAGHPLEARLRAADGASLVFSYGVPAQLPFPEGSELHVALLDEADGIVLERDFALDRAGSQPSWSEARIELAGLGSEPEGPLRVRFELRSEPGSACALGEPALVQRHDDAPTVLLVTSDTHRADHVGAANAGVSVRTPVLDALAARGVLFEDCVSSINLTLPSHAALLTGVHPRDSAVVGNVDRLAQDAPTLAERFQDAGWVTLGAVSVDHLVQGGVSQGFDRFSGPAGFQRSGATTLEKLVPWIDEARGLPLFVWVHVFDAHDPYEPPEDYRYLYYPAERDPYDPSLPEVPVDLQAKWDPKVRDLDYVEAQYRSSVTYLDEVLGDLFGHARFTGAIVALTADHGESLQGRRNFDHLSLYPNTIAIPLIMAWPEADAGSRVATPVQQIDVGRTLLDLAGLEDAPFPGQNLFEARDGPRFGLGGNLKSAAIYHDGWFLTLALKRHVTDEGGAPTREHEVTLFRVEDDPQCKNDLSQSEPERTRRMRAALVEWLTRPHSLNWSEANVAQDGAMVEQLAQLGYATATEDSGDELWFDPECSCSRCAAFR
jgi:arylsulfatase A-like enzyme